MAAWGLIKAAAPVDQFIKKSMYRPVSRVLSLQAGPYHLSGRAVTCAIYQPTRFVFCFRKIERATQVPRKAVTKPIWLFNP